MDQLIGVSARLKAVPQIDPSAISKTSQQRLLAHFLQANPKSSKPTPAGSAICSRNCSNTTWRFYKTLRSIHAEEIKIPNKTATERPSWEKQPSSLRMSQPNRETYFIPRRPCRNDVDAVVQTRTCSRS